MRVPEPMFTLTGRWIELAPLRLDHLDALCAIGLEPLLWRATTIQVLTRAEMEDYIRAALEARDRGTAVPFVILDRTTGNVIGSTRFHSIDPPHRHLEIGYTWLALPWQRTAANTEAKYLMLCHAFEAMGCIRVEFRADSENDQSRRALERVGAREEGVLRHYRISAHRGIRDLVIYSILADEWPRVRLALQQKLGMTDGLPRTRLASCSEPVPMGLEEALRELGAGDSRFRGTSFGRGECDLTTFLQECLDAENGRNLPPDKVPQSTYWLLDGGERVVGIVRVRHRLNARLLQYGGHVGYYVRPSARSKGYGTVALQLGLERLRRLGVERALLTVSPTNTVSKRIVLAHGGIHDGQGTDPVSGEIADRYWIAL